MAGCSIQSNLRIGVPSGGPCRGGLQVRFEPYRLSLVGCCFEYDPKDTVKIWIAS